MMKKNAILVLLFLMGVRGAVAGETVSLAGEWRFALDASKTGVGGEWFKKDLTDSIKLPGTMDDAGLGPKNTKAPTLEGPYRLYDYAGPAWYQRDIEIPPAWVDKRVSLFLERCRWVTTVWLDDQLIGSQDSLIAPHVYDFGTGVKPGKHRLTICVDNTVKLNLGRFVSALFGGTWGNMNGMVGRIELAATPPVWIDDVQVYPDLAKKSALVKVRIGNATGKAGSGTVSVGAEHVEAVWDLKGGTCEIEVPVNAKPWDEFTPNLTEVTVVLGEDKRTVRFGMREFSAKGTQFTLNGRPVYLRGTLECSIWPLTGYPPTDPSAWQRIYRIMKSYGLNSIRFHSWTPPDAAFAAADMEGIMIQAEGPMANVPAGKDPARDAFIEAEFKRIVDTYGNHPSFCTMTLGNEYGGAGNLLEGWVDLLRKRDPRHLYSSASAAQTTKNRQWTESAKGRGIHGAGTEGDLRQVIANEGLPMIGHEIGQWMFWPDSKEIAKWTGVMALKNFEMVRDDLTKKGLFDLEPQFVQASGTFATLLYKEEIEVLLRTPGYAGFSLLDLHDYPTQGTAVIGPLDAFWDSKGFVTPEKHRQYCGPVVPLLRIPKRTYTADEKLGGVVDLANYGPCDLRDIQPAWSIKDESGDEIASGSLAVTNALTGELSSLGSIEASLAKAKAPCKLTVTVSLSQTDVANEWEIWVYPADVAVQPPGDVVVCKTWDEAKAALADGKKVVLFAFPEHAATSKPGKGQGDGTAPAGAKKSAGSPLSLAGRFLPVFWSPVWFPSQKPNTMGILCDPKHPVFASFPTEFHSNWQWYNLMNNSTCVILNDAPASLRPIVRVIDNFARNNRMGCMFEGRVGNGKLLVCSIRLPAMAERDPAARQLMKSIYAYADSAAFNPAVELTPELMEKLVGQ